MARTSLVELLPPPPGETQDRKPAEPSDVRAPDHTLEPDAPGADPEPVGSSPVPDAEAGPRYLQMERKEARIRLDQADALAQLTRRLNRARRGRGERITDNTLIRVAVDLLLSQSDRLAGSSEAELRDALTL